MAKVDLGQVVGATGPTGPKGDTGPKGNTGATGNGIASITVTESTVDGGNNVVTVNMTDSTSKQFTVKNGTKGSKGDNGITPTFSIENGHLYADYDTPYTP